VESQPWRVQRRVRICVRVGLLTGIAVAVSLIPPLSHTGGARATAAETGLPKIRLDSLKNIRKAFDWIARGKPFVTELPKQNASPLAWTVTKRRAQIKHLASKLAGGDDWMCRTVDYLEVYDMIRTPSDAVAYAQDQALENGGGGLFEAMRLVDALDGLSDSAVRETVDAACKGRI
jgi:hypothetical protein